MKLSENSLKIVESRYDSEGWDACSRRVAEVNASNENGNKSIYFDKYYEMIYNMEFIPAGRILRNSGRHKGSLFNCYHLPIGDSIEEIGQFMKEALILWSEGGGLGCNFSSLRPKGDPIKGKGGKSSGLVSFIKAADSLAGTIESGGGRRSACLGLVDISHPEIMDFIDAKMVDGKLSYFNISVAINEEFLNHVEQNKDWEFKFKQKTYGSLKATKIWDKIINNMINWAEPGLINWSNFSKNNSYYYSPVRGPNPCAEATLAPYDVCDLGSLVLPNFVSNVNTNWKKLGEVIELAVRFLDNIIDINSYALKQNKIAATDSRRIGIGIMGLAEYLFSKKLKYGSEKAVQETEKLMKFIRDKCYESSIKLSIEKGSFSRFDPFLYSKASFVRKLPASLRADIKKHGIRNVTTQAIAPTGSVSLIPEVTGGIEPLFSKGYERRDRLGQRIYINPLYEKILNEDGSIPNWFVDINDLRPEDHLEMQVAVQKFTDGAVSKTINCSKDIKQDELSKILLEYIHDLKGLTIYVDGSREGQILNHLSKEDIKKYLKNKNKNNSLSEDDLKCINGTCEI